MPASAEGRRVLIPRFACVTEQDSALTPNTIMITAKPCDRLSEVRRMNQPDPSEQPPPVALREAVSVWWRIGLMSFGGPAGQIALMHRIIVEDKRWLSEARFLHALTYCMLLPGP